MDKKISKSSESSKSSKSSKTNAIPTISSKKTNDTNEAPRTILKKSSDTKTSSLKSGAIVSSDTKSRKEGKSQDLKLAQNSKLITNSSNSKIQNSKTQNSTKVKKTVQSSNRKLDIKSFIADINQHISHYDSLTEANAEEIIKHVKDELQSKFIRVTYEHPSIINKCISAGIPSSIRLVLSTQRGKANYSIPLCRQCNGIVIQFYECRHADIPKELFDEHQKIKCRILNIPSSDFNPQRPANIINSYISDELYDVFEANDGTTISIYYDLLACDEIDNIIAVPNDDEHDEHDEHNVDDKPVEPKNVKNKLNVKNIGKWILSTKRGLDVERMVWRGSSYGTVIRDLFAVYNFSLDKLDKNKCYTLGFKHPAFHPFQQPWGWKSETSDDNDLYDMVKPESQELSWIKRLWFIQSVCLETNVLSTNDDIGIPFQKSVNVSAFETQKYIQRLDKNANDSFEKYVSAIKNKDKHTTLEKDIPILFGYILRSKDPSRTKEYSDIFIESTLMKQIRNNIYNLPFIRNKDERVKKTKMFQNLKYIILEAYLDFRRRAGFQLLFPQYVYYFNKYDLVIDKTIEKIYTALSNRTNIVTDDHNQSNILAEFFISVVQDKVSIDINERKSSYSKPKPIKLGEFLPKTNKTKQLNEESTKKTIKDIIVTPKYLGKYIEVLYL